MKIEDIKDVLDFLEQNFSEDLKEVQKFMKLKSSPLQAKESVRRQKRLEI